MGSCLTKKASSSSDPVCQQAETEPALKEEPTRKLEEETVVKKEIFVIKHRKSHDSARKSSPSPSSSSTSNEEKNTTPTTLDVVNEAIMGNNSNINTVVRTSSCSKEELDAILIQCGRLSRSNSSGNVNNSKSTPSKKYSGSKRSFDFDHELNDCEGDDELAIRQHRQRHRQPSSSPSKGRRRTPSRERDQNQRSGSRERVNANGTGTGTGTGRRVSRSPGRRSDNNQNSSGNSNSNIINRPGKMVSVPATVSSLAMDKSNNPEQQQTTIKRISVKRNVGGGSSEGGTRTAASPRSQSPARANQQSQPSLSRSNSRKAEHSPYRRNPLSEIDPNSLAYPANNNKVMLSKPNAEINDRTTTHKSGKSTPKKKANRGVDDEQIMDEAKTQESVITHIIATPVADTHKPQKVMQSRSARLSRELDINPDSLLNPPPSYTTLLLEDIQNFHQKNNNNPSSYSLPACVNKACSIVEAVADLNSTTNSSFSGKNLPTDQSNYKFSSAPFVESEVIGSDDLMEPSFHKYVTVRRGGSELGGEIEEEESSGSNSFVGGAPQQWGLSSSTWESNSAESTDRRTSRSTIRDDSRTISPPVFQRHESSNDNNRSGIGRGRLGTSRGPHMNVIAAAAST
ncbi:hypothetical protein ACFE04_005139 [Oxalis oulophora]